MQYELSHRLLRFKRPATTSRGQYTTHLSHYVTLREGDHEGTGECSVLPDLSADALPQADYLRLLREAAAEVAATGTIPTERLRPYPSILFGLETALQALREAQQGQPAEAFSIPINGLVWMGSFEEMMERLEEKLVQGFGCVKLKIGAIDWQRERDIIAHVRQRYDASQVQLRVDANGGFRPDEAMERLRELAQFDIHSIEQPIAAGQWDEMATLCRQTPLPIALDEELIGVSALDEKRRLLDTLRPQFLVLKPSLHGGMAGTREWVRLAQERGIGSWITSALESNVGLLSIARLCLELYGPDITFPQGLGTGALYENNVPLPLTIQADRLCFSANF